MIILLETAREREIFFFQNSEINVQFFLVFYAFTTRIGHLCTPLPQKFEEREKTLNTTNEEHASNQFSAGFFFALINFS